MHVVFVVLDAELEILVCAGAHVEIILVQRANQSVSPSVTHTGFLFKKPKQNLVFARFLLSQHPANSRPFYLHECRSVLHAIRNEFAV